MRRNWMINMPLLLAAFGLFAAGCEQSGQTGKPAAKDPSNASESSDGTAKVQQPPPEIKLEVVDYEGYEQLVKSHRGKVVFVDIWATW